MPENLLKMNFFTHIFQEFYLDFKLLFIVLILGIISWKGVSRFSGVGGGGCFSDRGCRIGGKTEKGYKIWREIDLSLQNWHKEFDKCWPEHSKISKIFIIFKVKWGRGHPPGPSHYEKPWITLLYFFSPSNIYFAQREPIKMKVFESFKRSGQNSSSSLCQLWNDKSVPLYILRNSSLSWQIIPFWILSSYFFRFGLENPIKIPIFECSGKNLPYSYHVIFQTTGQLKVMLDKSANNVLGAGM